MAGKPNSKLKGGTVSLKVLITAASLTAMVSGWSVLAGKSNQEETDETPVPLDELSESQIIEVLDLGPIPTLIPKPTGVLQSSASMNSALPITGVPLVDPVNGLPVVKPVALNRGKTKSDLDKGGKESPADSPKEPVTNTRSS